MTFSNEEIIKLARLARISLTSAEKEHFKNDLSEITKYISMLEQVDVTGVEPMTHAVPLEVPLRADEVKPGVGRAGLTGSAGYEDGLIRVPKIIE
ncbi:MAG: Asp-tRNA(Asn)/Glu-tRNA(Gln) amidotransferase subunit GatC [bacterium]|nr:Asp-tRNA(Asn)/Glu-tRNA(Gln) amidotransferase subunit GatC [bacterium]